MKRVNNKSLLSIFTSLMCFKSDYRCIFSAGLLVLFVSAGRVSFSDENSPSRPYLFRDFGYLPQKVEVSHIFQVYNTGSDSLKVNKIESGCSCTSVSRIERPIPPGDSAAAKVIFKSGRYHHRVSKTTKVFTSDTIEPVRHLRIIAHVFKEGEETGPVTVTPAVLEWKIEKDTLSASVDTLQITNNGDRNLALEIEHYPGELIEHINAPESIDPGRTVNLILEVSAGNFEEPPIGLSLTLAFIGADTTRVTVPLKVKE